MTKTKATPLSSLLPLFIIFESKTAPQSSTTTNKWLQAKSPNCLFPFLKCVSTNLNLGQNIIGLKGTTCPLCSRSFLMGLNQYAQVLEKKCQMFGRQKQKPAVGAYTNVSPTNHLNRELNSPIHFTPASKLTNHSYGSTSQDIFDLEYWNPTHLVMARLYNLGPVT